MNLVRNAGKITPPKFQVQLECMNSKRIFLLYSVDPWNIIDMFQGCGTDPHGRILLCLSSIW